MPDPIYLTDVAQEHIQEIIQEKGIPDFYGLRIGLRGAGCGASYLLGFDTKGESDESFRVSGLNVFIERRHLMYVLGLEIDFEEGEDGAGFTFTKNEPSPAVHP